MRDNGITRRTNGHEFLFEPLTWRATGSFWSGEGAESRATGLTRIVHRDGLWTIEGSMDLEGPPGGRFDNVLRVAPAGPGAMVLPWRSADPAVGEIEGTFTVVGDALLSQFRSADGRHSGSECLVRIAPGRYRSHGAFEVDAMLAGAWRMELERAG